MNDELRTEFGPFIRRAREKRGLSLQQVAATTKISARVLEALERNDISKLPGGIFSRSFVRAYAREVGLDPEETVVKFVEAFPPETEERAPAAASHADDAESFESGRRTAITLIQILGVSLLVVIVIAVYRNMRPAPVAPQPAREAQLAEPAATPAPPAALPVGGTAVPGSEPVAGTVLSNAGSAGAVPQPPGGGLPATAAPVPEPGGPLVATPDTPLALSVLAGEECWLSLSVDGQKVVARTLLPGERVQFRARSVIVLSAGNAGALTLTLNGKPVRALGARGEVVTTTMTLGTLKNFIQ